MAAALAWCECDAASAETVTNMRTHSTRLHASCLTTAHLQGGWLGGSNWIPIIALLLR